MLNLRRHARARLAVGCALLVGAVGVVGAGSAAAVSSYGPAITIYGHGYGHGRGLGQWGAYGYAVDKGWDWRQILDRYYGGTSQSTVTPDSAMTVRLQEMDGLDLIVRSDTGQAMVNNLPGGPYGAILLKQVPGTKTVDVYIGANSCDPADPLWTKVTASPIPVTGSAPVVVDAIGRTDDAPAASLLSVCEPDGQRRYYRGTIWFSVDSNGPTRTVNAVGLESYLRGVVPRESPASWGDAGGGKGMNALRAQAVAARSYSLSENRYSYARTCDSQTCQVYGGAAVVSATGTFKLLEDPRSDRAIVDTALVVRVGPTGSPARTEFSSSTGGYTAGGTFPAVADDGDSTAPNPHDSWATSVSRDFIAQRWPEIGDLLLVDVTRRNGFGEWGGRVQTVVLRGTTGSVAVTGDAFRLALNLQSDWYFVVAPFTTDPIVGLASTADGKGYWVTTNSGAVIPFGLAGYGGSMAGVRLNSPVIGMTNAASNGYWLLGRDGGIFSFGGAQFYGSTGSIRLNAPVVAMAGRPQGDGYWFVASDGGVFAYGGAPFLGSMGGKKLNKPVVGMAPTASGLGYWLVASDGGIFSFGDAAFYGSTGGIKLTQPIIGIAARPQGDGYWMLAADGGVFAFGSAPFAGSGVGATGGSKVVSIASSPSGNGYRLVTAGGTVLAFGDASAS